MRFGANDPLRLVLRSVTRSPILWGQVGQGRIYCFRDWRGRLCLVVRRVWGKCWPRKPIASQQQADKQVGRGGVLALSAAVLGRVGSAQTLQGS